MLWDIFNTDRGSQFTGAAFTWTAMGPGGTTCSLSGCEAVCLSARTRNRRRGTTLAGISTFTTDEGHSSLDDMIPDQAYFNPPQLGYGGLTPAEAPLIDAEICLDKQGQLKPAGILSCFDEVLTDFVCGLSRRWCF
jgi:hypothetical protein